MTISITMLLAETARRGLLVHGPVWQSACNSATMSWCQFAVKLADYARHNCDICTTKTPADAAKSIMLSLNIACGCSCCNLCTAVQHVVVAALCVLLED